MLSFVDEKTAIECEGIYISYVTCIRSSRDVVNHIKGFQEIKDLNLRSRMFRMSPVGGPEADEIQVIHGSLTCPGT